MRGVFLDTATLGEDIDLAPLKSALTEWRWFATTSAGERAGHIAEAEVVVTNKVPLDASLLAQAPGLRLVCVAATGTDHIDVAAAAQRSITVCNVRGYATASVVQHVFALIFALTTRLVPYVEDVRAGAWSRSPVFCRLDHPIAELAGKTLGVVGYGTLGQAVAERAQGLGMDVWTAERPRRSPRAGRVAWDEFLRAVDVLTLHCPLTPETRGLIGAQELAAMKPGALLINTARGGIVDEIALADALRRGDLGGAGIDVLAQEPPPADHPLLAHDIPNLIVTPHIAWASRESRQRLVEEIAENIRAFRGKRPRNVVCG